MRKVASVLIMLMIFLCGCTSTSKTNIISGVDEKTHKEFEDEKLESKADLSALTKYKFDDSFNTVRFIIEGYENGELVNTTEFSLGEHGSTDETDGFIVMYAVDDEKNEIEFLLTRGDDKQGTRLDVAHFFENKELLPIGAVSLAIESKNIEIVSGSEYLVSAMRLGEAVSDNQEQMPTLEAVIEDINVIDDIPYMLLMKCEFIKE